MLKKDIQNRRDLKEYIETKGGVASVEMWIVRNAHGHDRLGKHVRHKIAQDLAGAGLNYYHESGEMPDDQRALLRIYKQGTRAAEIIEAVLSVSFASDATIRGAAADESKDTLETIRKLIAV